MKPLFIQVFNEQDAAALKKCGFLFLSSHESAESVIYVFQYDSARFSKLDFGNMKFGLTDRLLFA